MRRLAASLFLAFALLSPVPAAAEEIDRTAQVPLLPAAGRPADVVTLARSFWGGYLDRGGDLGFTLNDVLVGQVDLNDDGVNELFLMIDKESWRAEHGKPFVVARWQRGAWLAIGWGWGDEDGVFLGAERRSGWRTIDAGPHYLRWQGRQYGLTTKE